MLVQKIIAFIFLITALPFFVLAWAAIKIEDGGKVLYKQKRWGKDKRPFMLYKIRTMVESAEKDKQKYLHLNEADGPVFKIRNDPRHTNVGKFLVRTGLDELPQLINIIKGEMAFVGPRPLPVVEAKKVPKKYNERFSVLPGITSSWVVRGSHKLSFEEWMRLDVEYANKYSPFPDLKIAAKTVFLMIKWLARQSISLFTDF